MKNFLYYFFVWCAGSDRHALEKSAKSEHIKHSGYGGLVLVPAILALFSMTYAIYTLTDNRSLYMAAGLGWALIVFAFDRFIVSTFRKAQNLIKDIFSLVFLSRFIFAAFVGILVAHPLVMLVFDENISEWLKENERTNIEKIRSDYESKITQIKQEIKTINDKIEAKEKERNEQQKLYQDETMKTKYG